jgi:hypothetical protein
MSTPGSKHALALYAFLEKEWAAMKTGPYAWCREVGIADPTVFRWKQGVEPDMRSLRRVAEALGRPVLEILIAVRYVSVAEANGHVVAPPPSYSVLEALERDQSISDDVREVLRQVYDSVMAIESGAAKKATVRRKRGVTSTRQKPLPTKSSR